MLDEQPLKLGLVEIGELRPHDLERALDSRIEAAVAKVSDGFRLLAALPSSPQPGLGLREESEWIFARARAILRTLRTSLSFIASQVSYLGYQLLEPATGVT